MKWYFDDTRKEVNNEKTDKNLFKELLYKPYCNNVFGFRLARRFCRV